MKSLKNRSIGEETPFIRLSIFKIRLPFIHYRFEWPDYLQGLLMCAVDLAAIPLLMDILGMPFEVAVSVVILNGLLYLTKMILTLLDMKRHLENQKNTRAKGHLRLFPN